MFIIPGWLIALLTFPGVICHEIAHRFFCDVARVPVYGVSYLRLRNPVGFVLHAPTQDLKSALLVSVGPLLINTFLCSLITFAAVIPTYILEIPEASVASVVLMWVGISIGMHAFPSDTDMDGFIETVVNSGQRGFVLKLAKVFGALFSFANALRFIWFDALYAFGVALLLPGLTIGIWGSL